MKEYYETLDDLALKYPDDLEAFQAVADELARLYRREQLLRDALKKEISTLTGVLYELP
jgi:hypothetical protein